MFATFYVIIFAFLPDLKLDGTKVEQSFGHDLLRFVNEGCLNHSILQYADPITLKQLHDCAIKVSKRKFKHTINKCLQQK